DMGGAGFVFTGENDAEIMRNSASINLNVLEVQRRLNDVKNVNKTKIFYSSSACIYPEYNQLDPDNPNCREESAYPAAPDSEYGWEKLFSKRLYFAYHRNHGIPVRVARYSRHGFDHHKKRKCLNLETILNKFIENINQYQETAKFLKKK
ncbi:MAG: NAD-dependent epimerase/dehydratase family protein, partial [Sphaerospermopsis kisseleviana]